MLILKIIYTLLAIIAIISVSRVKKKIRCDNDCWRGTVISLIICALGVIYTKQITIGLLVILVINILIKTVKKNRGNKHVKKRKIDEIHGRKEKG